MYAAIRHPTVTSADEFTKKIEEDLTPDLEKLPGFQAFYVFKVSEQELVSIMVFDTKEQAEESNRHALDWIRDRVSDMVTSGPNPVVGEVTVSVTAKQGKLPQGKAV
jgi:hypothetical protein